MIWRRADNGSCGCAPVLCLSPGCRCWHSSSGLSASAPPASPAGMSLALGTGVKAPVKDMQQNECRQPGHMQASDQLHPAVRRKPAEPASQGSLSLVQHLQAWQHAG